MLLNRHFKKSISGLLYSDLLILVCPRQVQIIYHVYGLTFLLKFIADCPAK